MNNIEIELKQKEFELTQCLKNKAIDPVRYDMRAYYYNSQRELILRSEIESLKRQLGKNNNMEITSENQIEILRKKAIESAQNYVKTRCLSGTSEVVDVSFLAGAKWALSHQWISVNEALPPVEESIGKKMWSTAVLVRTPKGGVFIDKYVFHHETWLNNGNFVSYWMPFPEFSEE